MTSSHIVALVGVGATKAQFTLAPGKTTLGRSLKELNCPDKKVSREHAFIEVDPDGKVILTANHINPCFIHDDSGGSPRSLKKGDSITLNEGDTFSLLPSQYMYMISCPKSKKKQPVADDSEKDESEEEEEEEEEDEDDEEEEDEDEEELEPSEEDSEESDYASPKKKARGSASGKKGSAGRPTRKAVKQPVKVDFINDDEAEDEDFVEDDEPDDDSFKPSSDEDWEEDSKPARNSRKKKQPSSEEEDSDEDWGKPKKKKSRPAKRPRPSSARRQPTRGRSASNVKYQESDSDDDY